jgi:methylenetetrahydrofolate dehydrogenase (NADP+)/methenyltetrahydrofolate cyclohydrolase
MILLDGQSLAKKILSSLKFANIRLDIILIGNHPQSLKYIDLKLKKAQELGVKVTVHRLPETTPQSEILSLINCLNHDQSVTGFLIQLPLPSHLNRSLIINSIHPAKDVDGLTVDSSLNPAVVTGIIKLLDEYHLELSGKKIVVVNDSSLVGQPLKRLLHQRGGLVTLCNDQTRNLTQFTNQAGILISATGVKKLITADMVKDRAVVIDAANGDVDFAAVSLKCSYITPTYGSIGPLTIACLFENLYKISHHNAPPALRPRQPSGQKTFY